MNQRFTIRAVIEYNRWPAKDDVSNETVEACARAEVQDILNKSMPGAMVVSTEVKEVVCLPVVKSA